MAKAKAPHKNPAAVALGRLRARHSYEQTVKARWEGTTPEERSAAARHAVLIRWRRYRATQRQRSA
jgi:hypothetical protein